MCSLWLSYYTSQRIVFVRLFVDQSLSLSLCFRLCIPQVGGHPHGFFFSSRLNPLHPLVWGSGWWGIVRWCLSISSSLPSPIPTSIHFSFEDTLDAVVIFSSLDMSVPSQSWLTHLLCNAGDSNSMANVIISFPVLQCDTKHPSEHSHFSSFKKPVFTSSLFVDQYSPWMLMMFCVLIRRYLCDYIYYTSMSVSRSNCAFIHVPPINRPYTARQLAESIRVAILSMLAQIDGRDQASA